MWLFMITLHAVAALISFVAGLVALSPTRAKRRPWIFSLYLSALIGMVIFVSAAVVTHWQKITSTEHFVFLGLVLLGLYMIYRALHAKRLFGSEGGGWKDSYMDDIGFTLIALFDGFVIVGAIDIGLPGLVVAIGAVSAVVLGHFGIERAKSRES